jgi:two-component system KDP operon response regulator KdpE
MIAQQRETASGVQREGTGLVIDDEPQIRRVVRHVLSSELARIVEAANGSEGLDLAAAEKPILIILDLGLPDMPGLDVCKEIRRWSTAAIVVLSARQADTDKAMLLDAGADDYLSKPFSTLELKARVRANLRRTLAAQLPGEHRLTIGDLVMDVAARTVKRGDQAIHLTPIEWELLRTFAIQAGRTLTHRQLFSAVWGRTFGDPQQYLRVHVANLRRKIERDPVRPQVIVTEPGVGYRLDLPG